MVSIIIPTLNEEHYLPRLLDSIEKQDFKDYEIIVSDAGSQDRTREIAASRGVKLAADSKIKHPSAQRNAGAAVAKGDILLFLDADSEIGQGFLVDLVSQFGKKQLTGAGCYIRFNPNNIRYSIYAIISNVICGLKQYGRHPAAVGAGLAALRSAHEKIGGFDLNIKLAEDYDYCERLAGVGRFRMLESVRLLYSSRRMEKEGFWKTGWTWLRMGLYTLTNRKIKKDIIKYDFGKF
ncbi:MAG: glycosyltransferase [Bacillota bacterium]